MGPISPAARLMPGTMAGLPTPVKSILKPASVLGRRKFDDASLDEVDDGDDDNVGSSAKRRKVIFDEIRNETYEVGGRNLADVKKEVKLALERHLRGDDGQYDSLKKLFSRDGPDDQPLETDDENDGFKPQELQAYLIALTACLPTLKSKDCNGLVKAILRSAWLGCDDDYVKVYTHFLAALISAQGTYLAPVLSMIVRRFKDRKSDSWCVPDMPEVPRDVMRDRLHSTLRFLLRMFPSASRVLEGLLGANFPFPDESTATHMAYIHNILRVKDYVPELREEVLDLVLNRVVKIDAQMQVDLEDVDDDIAAAVMFALRDQPRHMLEWEDDGLDDSDNDSVDSDDGDVDEDALKTKTIKESVEKMDAMLDTLFDYYTPDFANPGSDKAFDTFTIILREFDQMVLPTYKSRHTQFLAFHFAQRHERLTDAFCGQLIATAFQGNTPNVLKQAAAAYLASFVARGAHVPGSLVRTIFMLLIHHLDQYRKRYEPICRGPDLKRFHPYYSLLQATLYIFCFRWQDLVVSAPDIVDPEDSASYIGQELEWIGSSKQDLSSHISGKLNPLKVCAPVIVEEFAKLAHRLNFMYIYHLVENNKRIRLTQFLSSTYATGGALRDAGYESQDESFHQLDPYFPFDPYQLPISKRWLEGDYVSWKAVSGLNAEDEDDSSDEDDEQLEDDAIEDATATDSEGELSD